MRRGRVRLLVHKTIMHFVSMDVTINRSLNLRNSIDRLYFYDQLQKSKDLAFPFEEIKNSIEFISNYLTHDDWLIVYPGVVSQGQTSISHGSLITKIQIASFKGGRPLYHLFNFIEDIVPLGLNLLKLRSLAYFERYIQHPRNARFKGYLRAKK
jgi:hypothetical protein